MKGLKLLALWSVSLLLLFLLLRALSPGDVGRSMLAADPQLLATGALLSLAATVLGAFNSHLLVSIRHPVAFASYLRLFWTAWAVGLVLPGQVGDVGVLSWMMRREGMRWTHSLGRLVVDKLISLLVIAALAAWGLLRVAGRLQLVEPATGWGLLLVLVLLGVGVIAAAWHHPRSRRWLQHGLDVFEESAQVLREHPGRVLANLLLTVVKVLLLSASFWFICRAAGMEPLPFVLLVQLMAVGSIVAYVPVSMNGVGTVELAAVALFPLFGFDSGTVLAAYLVARITTLLLAWLPALGLLLLQFTSRPQGQS